MEINELKAAASSICSGNAFGQNAPGADGGMMGRHGLNAVNATGTGINLGGTAPTLNGPGQ